MAKLKTYRAKRDFGKTKEPRGRLTRAKTVRAKTAQAGGGRYVIQKHDATRLHYDLRLELDGVMLSWAVTRGPSLVPGEKRLAIHVENHPIEYNKFEGTIPEGEYGGGTVMIWDRGSWTPEGDPHKGMKKGHLDFELEGEKLNGRWHLVRMKKRPKERQEPWLLIKSDDDFARGKSDPDILEQKSKSVVSGRSIPEIAKGKRKVWHSNRPKGKAPRAATLQAKPMVRKSAKARSTPEFIPPCFATLSDKVPAGGDWLHEIKFDGYRIQARVAGGHATLKTRTGLDWTGKFSTIAEACSALAQHDAIIDGEIVSGDANGVSDFSALQDDLKTGRDDRLVYYVFDLLHLDGDDLTGTPLIERKTALRKLLAALPQDGVIRFSDDFEAEGATLLNAACRMHLEGVMSKRRGASYRSGRSGDWIKTKCSNSQEFVVAGYEPSDKAGRAIRSLLLAYHDKEGLRYAGRVGTGWGEAIERDLVARLEPLATETSPFDKIPAEERRRKVKWVEPRLVAEVEFRGWTGGTLVRQAALKGLREDKPAKQVVREVSKMPKQSLKASPNKAKAAAAPKAGPKTKTAKSGPVAVAGVPLSHPDRVYWDDAGVTKQMLAQYYEQVWDHMRPHVVGRVLALLRCPDGQTASCFFQKHASAGVATKRLHLVTEPGGGESISIDDLPGLISLAQAGVLEVHVRGSSIKRLEEADRLVFDLDPGPGVGWKDIVAGAREVRERLQDLKLESFVKTTGGKGAHVVLPIQPTPWDDAKDFCRGFAEAMAADSPERYTATIKKTARTKKIFIDYLRNSREATAVAPYSTRARPGATVSMPLTWEELGSQKVSNAFTVLNAGKRLARMGSDPWKDIGRIKQRLPTTRK